MGWPQKSFINPRQRQRLQLVLPSPLRQRAELVAQVREQQRAEGGVRRNQLTDGLPRQLVGHHFFSRHKTAADLACHQAPAVETIIGTIGGDDLVAVELRDVAFDDDKEMGRHGADVENDLALRKIRDVNAVPNQTLLVRVQAVKRRGSEVEGIGHGCIRWTACPVLLRPFDASRDRSDRIPGALEPRIAQQIGA